MHGHESVDSSARPDSSPIDVHRASLYTPDELYGSGPYVDSLDARAYRWSLDRGGTADHLARTLHDLAIDEALDAWLQGRHLVGVMGGHDVRRGEPAYADAVRLGHGLGADHVVTTGGGPGAMEAANLGGLLAHQPVETITAAVAELATAPAFADVDAWLEPALDVRRRLTDPSPSLGVPTWFYGHEPSNVFATAIAKYFRNALREAILLQICDAGIVFLPGVGGTVQEIFQDACENYYAAEGSVATMVLVGATYWTETLPAWPLLHALARGRAMEHRIHLVDTIEEAVAVVGQATDQRPAPSDAVRSATTSR